MFNLKWRKKIYWIDEEDEKLYIHPLIAFTIFIATIPTSWYIIDWITRFIGRII